MNHLKVAEDIKLFLEKVKPLFQVVESLEKVGSLEQSEASALVAQEKAKKLLYEVNNEIAVKKIELDLMKKEVEKGQKALDEAKAYAEGMKLELKASCDKEYKEAQARLEEYKKASEAEKQNLVVQLNALKKDIEASAQELDATKAKVADVKAKLAEFLKG